MSCSNTSSSVTICSQTNVPQVDETAIECAECGFTSTNCIVNPNAISYLNLPANSSMTDVVDALLLSLIDARNRIEALETP